MQQTANIGFAVCLSHGRLINKNLKRLNEMQKVIVYGSEYGTTKRYADELSNKTGVKAFAYTDVHNLTTYDKILYLGGLYAWRSQEPCRV